MRYGLLVFFLFVASTPLMAQSMPIEFYTATIVTMTSGRFFGVLDEVTETHINLIDDGEAARSGKVTIPLTDVKRVVVRRKRKRGAAITGAVIGGLVTDYFVIQSATKNPFSSPVSYGISLVFAAGAGAGLGAIVGQKVGGSTRRVFRPIGPNASAAIENLRRQLTPFTYADQDKVLNRARP